MEGIKDFMMQHSFMSANHALNDQNQLNSNDASFNSYAHFSEDPSKNANLLEIVKNEHGFDALEFDNSDINEKKRRRQVCVEDSSPQSEEKKKVIKKKAQLTVTFLPSGEQKLETDTATFIYPLNSNISNNVGYTSMVKLPSMNQTSSPPEIPPLVDMNVYNLGSMSMQPQKYTPVKDDRAALKQEYKSNQAMNWNNNTTNIRTSPSSRSPALAQHPTNSALLVGSCHQCKRRREISVHTLCRSKRGTKHCKLKYCEVCLKNHYPQILPSEEEILNNVEWTCPKCRGMCHCVSCKRNGEKKQIVLTDKQSDGTGLKFSHPDLQRLTNMIQASGVQIIQAQGPIMPHSQEMR